jgi:hypothetical protein
MHVADLFLIAGVVLIVVSLALTFLLAAALAAEMRDD